jgi:hypothetical protein
MVELEQNGYYPLTKGCLELSVPMRPGIYMLAIRLANGVQQNIFTSQSENLYTSLRKLAEGDLSQLPRDVATCLDRYQCYFTYFVILRPEYRDEVQKLLTHTSDPVVRLNIVSSN